MSSKYTDLIWSITDMIKLIGKWKSEFEVASDIEKLNNTQMFQIIMVHIFYYEYDTSLLFKNAQQQRLIIKICKHKPNVIIIELNVLDKYKRKPRDILILVVDKNEHSCEQQLRLSKYILKNDTLLSFFKE